MADADPSASPGLSPREVPALRRELAEWHAGPPGVMWYENAIRFGRQRLKPPGSIEKAAQLLAAGEAGRLRDGDLWFVDDDLCALLNAAHPSMPAFAPTPTDLLSKVGFAVFAEPIAVYPAAESRDASQELDPDGTSGFREVSDRIYARETSVVAVSWGPVDNPHWRAGGVWMSFYVRPAVHDDGIFDDPAAARRARAMLPRLVVDNEAAVAWRPKGDFSSDYLLPTSENDRGTLSWTRLVFAAFQLAAQANLAESETAQTDRAERRRTVKANLPDRPIRIVRLRRALATMRDGEQSSRNREWRHRWIVRGHWRNHWYPSLGDHRPMWIAPFLKGPGGAPLLTGEKVTVLGAPTDADGDQPTVDRDATPE